MFLVVPTVLNRFHGAMPMRFGKSEAGPTRSVGKSEQPGGFTLLAAACVLALTGACGGAESPLQVGDVSFSGEEVRGLSQDQLRALSRITAVGLAVREGRELELGGPVLDRRHREARVRRLQEEVALEQADVDDTVLRARYETLPEWELEVRHLVVLSERWRSDEHRDEARQRAEAALARVRAGDPFAEVAGEVSEEPGAAERGGLLAPGREGTWVREFWDAASRLDPGEVSPVVETEYGFHVLKLEDRRPVPFEEARPRIASEVAEMLTDQTAWDEWTAALLEPMELEPELLGESGVPSPDDERVVARWNGNELTLGELAMTLEGFPSDRLRPFRNGAPGERARLLEEVARLRFLNAEARRREIELPDPTAAEIDREWERTVAAWATFFRFEPDLPLEDLRERALEGLAGTGQNLAIAREEVDRWRAAVERAYSIRMAPDG